MGPRLRGDDLPETYQKANTFPSSRRRANQGQQGETVAMTWLLATTLAAAGAPAALPPPERVAAIAADAMAATGAKGIAIAVIDDGKVRSAQAFGARNAAGDPLTPDTIMYGASLTKLVFSYYVMMLVDEGRLDLDRPLATYLPQPLPDYGNVPGSGNWGDLADDPRWRRVTARHVLNHATGFANFAFLEPDGKLRFHFDPGSRYGYSGEGIHLLQFVLERGLGLDTGAEVQRRLFAPLGMTRISLIWRPDFAANLADGWTIEGKPEPHDERSRVRAAGSMDTTITDLATLTAAMARGWGLSAKTRRAWTRGTMRITTPSQFPTLAPEAPPARRFPIKAALGPIAFSGPQGPGWVRGGHNDTTGNALVCVERGRRCVLILSNDVRSEPAFTRITRAVLGETGAPYRWTFGEMKLLD